MVTDIASQVSRFAPVRGSTRIARDTGRIRHCEEVLSLVLPIGARPPYGDSLRSRKGVHYRFECTTLSTGTSWNLILRSPSSPNRPTIQLQHSRLTGQHTVRIHEGTITGFGFTIPHPLTVQNKNYIHLRRRDPLLNAPDYLGDSA